ncbi:MAG: hypothetical protein O9301_02890 [Leptospira sp.]|nr:hypothetical protein [Leptospira sp.]
MRGLFLSIWLPAVFVTCTNYSTTPSVQAPPTLVSIENKGNSNFIIKVRAQNPELIFRGYRLHTGITEQESRNPIDVNIGTDCVLAPTAVVQPTEYLFEADPSEAANSAGVVCRFRTTLTPGQFLSIRTLGLAINLQNSTSTLSVSPPSNSLLIP